MLHTSVFGCWRSGLDARDRRRPSGHGIFQDDRHARWALWTLGLDAEAHDPSWLREQLRQRALALAAHYATDRAQPGTTTAPVLSSGVLSGRTQPVLFGDGLVLRPWQETDAEQVARAYEDPAIHRWHARSLTDDQAGSWVRYERDRWVRESGASWAVVVGGELAGRVALSGLDLHEACAEVSYWVVPGQRGAGVAVRAVCALADWAFGDLGLHRLELQHSTSNPASCRVAAKAGFRAEGTARASALHLDGWHDMHLHALVAADARTAAQRT